MRMVLKLILYSQDNSALQSDNNSSPEYHLINASPLTIDNNNNNNNNNSNTNKDIQLSAMIKYDPEMADYQQ